MLRCCYHDHSHNESSLGLFDASSQTNLSTWIASMPVNYHVHHHRHLLLVLSAKTNTHLPPHRGWKAESPMPKAAYRYGYCDWRIARRWLDFNVRIYALVLKLAISISQTVPERDINIPRKAPFSCPSIRSKLSIYYVIIDRESRFYEFYFFKFVNVTEL